MAHRRLMSNTNRSINLCELGESTEDGLSRFHLGILLLE